MQTRRRSHPKLVAMISAVSCAVSLWGCTGDRGPTQPERVPLLAQGPGDTFIPIDYPGAISTSAQGINPRGEIVGQYTDAAGMTHGFLRHTDGSFSSIDYPGAVRTLVGGIDASSDVVGAWSDGSRDHGYVLSNGTFSSFDFTQQSTVANSTFGAGITPSGEIVGEYKLQFLPFGTAGRAFIRYGDGTFEDITPVSLGASAAVAWGINASGDAVGYFVGQDNNKGIHGWLRDNHGAYTEINYPGASSTNARGISPSGDIVGLYRVGTSTPPAPPPPNRGFVLTKEGDFIPVDYPGSTATRLLGVNAQGDIVGDYRDASRKTRGFLLTNQ